MDFLNLFDLIAPMVSKFGHDLSPGRTFESLIIVFVVWRRLKPHLEKIENRLGGLENALNIGFQSGNQRFEKIENRLDVLEQLKNPKEGKIHENSI